MMETKQKRKDSKSHVAYHIFPQVFSEKREVVPEKILVQAIGF